MLFAIILSGVLCVSCLGAPPAFVTPCRLADGACVREAAQHALPEFTRGLPELGVEALDPMHLDVVDFELAGLKFKLQDGRVKGWKNITVDRIEWNEEKKILTLVSHGDFSLRGHYTAGGQLLVLPITGDGDFKLKTKDMHFNIRIPSEIEVGEDGKNYLKLKSYKFTFDVKGNAHYTLTNLFNGNKDLGDAMHNFLNDNWHTVTHEFGGPVLEEAIKKMFTNIKTFFAKVPLEDLTLQ